MDPNPRPGPIAPVPAPAPSPHPEPAALRAHLRVAVDQLDRLAPAGLRALVLELEEAGMVAEAVRATRRILELDPRDGASWARLAALHDELADFERAARCRARASALGTESAPGPGPAPSSAADPQGFADADLERFAALFAGREDHHASQWYDPSTERGGYSPVPAPLTASVVRGHLAGRVTVGSYLLRADGSVRFVCLDLDANRQALEQARGDAERVAALRGALDRAGRSLCGALGQLGVPHLYEDSGHKGRHAWIFFARPVPAAEARRFGDALNRAHGPRDERLHLEVFPKQDAPTGKGLGNLVKLPLGLHRVSGRRSELLRADGSPEPNPAQALQRLGKLDPDRIPELVATLVGRAPHTAPTGAPSPPAARPSLQVWTEEDLAADPQFTTILAGCAVLRRVAERALASDPLCHDELVALEHTLGHLDHGAEGVNLLLARVPGVSAERRLGRRHQGHPTSCAKLRRQLVGIAHKVGCNCDFGPRLTTYPNPLLHLGGGSGASLTETED